jgi:MoxR-like ATPase
MSENQMTVAELGENIRRELGKVIQGQHDVIEQLLICLLARGHALLEGVPGIAKTLMAKTLAHVIGGDFKRVQFTPDMMPSDITGTNVFDAASSTFRLRYGPVFTNVLLADEINRTPPKTQAALLEAMEERRVTIDGVDHLLPPLFFVMATENPIEYEGTYPLPEAQLDRFLLKIVLDYPSEAEEKEILRRYQSGFDPHDLTTAGVRKLVTSPEELQRCWDQVGSVRVEEGVFDYVAQVVRRTRGAFQVSLGGSPRATVALFKCSRALAALQGRDYVTPDDVKRLAPPVLRHRLLLEPEAEIEGVTPDQIVSEMLSGIPVPR